MALSSTWDGFDGRMGGRLPDVAAQSASQAVLDLLPAAVYVCALDGTILHFNRRAAELWGRAPLLSVPRDRFCGAYRLYRPNGDLLPHDTCPMADILRDGIPVIDQEVVIERPDGSRGVALVNIRPLKDAAGNINGAVNCFYDITERKHIDQEYVLTRGQVEELTVKLAQVHEQQVALHQFTDRLYRADSRQAVYDAAFDAITGALGCERAAVLLFDESGVMRFVAWRNLSDDYRRAVDGHSPWTRDTKDPQSICVEDIKSADLPDALKATVIAEGIGALAFIPLTVKGALVGKFMTYYDAPHVFTAAEINLAITIARQLGFAVERMSAEDARLRAEQAARLLALIIENSDDAILSKDITGTVTSWNRGAERIFGYSADEMVGKHIITLIPRDRVSEEAGILERIRRGEHIDHFETVRRCKGGSLIDVSLTVSPIKDEIGKIIGASKIVRDITERKQAQARHDMLTGEIQHRTKNLFAVVQAVVARSFAGKNTVSEAHDAVVSRLGSLAQTHLMLMDHEWEGTELDELVRLELQPYADRVLANGPSLTLSAKAAQNFALALHELATNAAEYGAFSRPEGRVYITWSVTNTNGSGQFTFRWQERGGPSVSPPTQKGFGSTVLEHVMAEYFDSPPRIEFASGGVSYEIVGSLDSLGQQQKS
jgi:PAS domain S-box-containing protein